MPRELFGDVIDPSIKVGSRKWYSVPLSFTGHTLVIGAVIVAPLLATGALPMPNSGPMVIHIEPPPIPQPPAVRRATPPPAVARDAAPVVAPSAITPEPVLLEPFETSRDDVGIVGGVPIEGDVVIEPPPLPREVVREPTNPVRPGGVIRAPERVTYVAPEYPTLARMVRAEGLVIVEATIDTEGRVQAARILRSDSPLLNDAALAAVRQWVYTPTLLNGIAVSVIMTVTVHFQLR
jgi:periplasmic protein TonB